MSEYDGICEWCWQEATRRQYDGDGRERYKIYDEVLKEQEQLGRAAECPEWRSRV